MNLKAFFVDALTSALDLEIGTPDDVLRHVTPDVLAEHLPRPLWARLLTACLGAPRVDARLVVETIGIANLCEHVPTSIIWSCIAEIGARSLGAASSEATAASAPSNTMGRSPSGRAVLAPPPDVAPPTAPLAVGTGVAPVASSNVGPSIPAPSHPPINDVIADLERADDQPARQRTSTATRFRQSSTSVGRGLGASRRPQVSAPVPVSPGPLSRGGRRTSTEVTATDPEPETNVQAGWGDKEIAVDDSQLVDWQTDIGGASAITGDDDFSDLGNRKR